MLSAHTSPGLEAEKGHTNVLHDGPVWKEMRHQVTENMEKASVSVAFLPWSLPVSGPVTPPKLPKAKAAAGRMKN